MALIPTSTPQYVTFCIFCGTLQNTSTQPHITLLTFYLHSLSYPLCETGVTFYSGGLNWSMLAEIYLVSRNFFSMAASLPVG
jgi:hypothetical protein